MDIKAVAEPELTKEDFMMIRDFIHEKSGIYFAENKMYLVKNRLVKRMGELGINSYKDYFYHVKYDTSLKEFNKLMNLITTNETSFFRNEPQLLSFSDELLPKIIEEKRDKEKTIKIWSAGCSTGEEPYTLAILLLEKLLNRTGWRIEIIANDISEKVLTRARKGEYNGLTLRNVQPALLSKYFTRVNDLYTVKPEVKSLVTFSHMNLNDPRKISINTNFDVIFCRNVMIYFSDEIKNQLVRNFYNALRPGGYFYIGHSESLHGISKAFKLIYFKNALVYYKEPVGTEQDKKPSGGLAVRRVSFNKDATPSSDGSKRALEMLQTVKKTTVTS